LRYYSIKIDGAPAAFKPVPGATQSGAQWDTWINGGNDPGAQQVEFSIELTRVDLPSANSTLTVHGVSFDQIKQTSSLINKLITIYGGMKPGLPLATAQDKHSGMLVTGKISQCWGNWIGTDMSIGMVIAPSGIESGGGGGGGDQLNPGEQVFGHAAQGGGDFTRPPNAGPKMARTGRRSIDTQAVSGATIGGAVTALSSLFDINSTIGGMASTFFGGGGSIAHPANLIHNLQPNQLLSEAIRATLSTAFPKAQLNIKISPNLKVPYQDAGIYQSLSQISAYWKQLSHSILGTDKYTGIQTAVHGNTIHVLDGTNAGQSAISSPGQLSYLDLIGQPTWISINTINFKTVLRADIKFGDTVVMPPTLMTSSAASIVPFGDSSQKGALSFKGNFNIQKVLHIGDFRNPDGNAWCTVYEALSQEAGDGQTDPAKDTAKSNIDQSTDPEATAKIAAAAAHSGFEDTFSTSSTPPFTGPRSSSGFVRQMRRY
jgi:hypothetical protein